MQTLVRLSCLLDLLLVLTSLLVAPQQITDTYYPADLPAYLVVGSTGVPLESLTALAQDAGVELAQVRNTSEPASPYITVKVLGHPQKEQLRPPLTPWLSPFPIRYEGAAPQTDSLGPWHVVGSSAQAEVFIRSAQAAFGGKISESGFLDLRTTISSYLNLPLGTSLLLLQPALALVLTLNHLSRPAAFTSAAALGRSRSRLALRLCAVELRRAVLWVLPPIGLAATLTTLDAGLSTWLSVHYVVLALCALLTVLTLATFLIAALATWTVLSLTTQTTRPAMSTYPRWLVFTLTYLTALAMIWSFSYSSLRLAQETILLQSLRQQALAQQTLPRSVQLFLTSVSYAATEQRLEQWTDFLQKQQDQDQVFLAWSTDTGFNRSEHYLYLNNKAATHYEVPTTTPETVQAYIPSGQPLTPEQVSRELRDTLLTEQQFGAAPPGPAKVEVMGAEQIQGRLPGSLPALTLSPTHPALDEYTVVVVPDGFFSPDSLLSVASQGGLLLTRESADHVEEDLWASGYSNIVLTTLVGADTHQRLTTTATALAAWAVVLLGGAATGLCVCGLAARSWVEVTQRTRSIRTALGRRHTRDQIVIALLLLPPLLLLTAPLAARVTTFSLALAGGGTLLLLLAVLLGTRSALQQPQLPRADHPTAASAQPLLQEIAS